MSDVEGIERIRYVTSHPRYMSLAVVEAVSRHKKLAKCFHIPFQAGDDEILRAMGRGHTVAQYLNIVDRIRALCPDAAITADVIVGFPGETEEQFQNSLTLMETVRFDTVNTAAYSPRPNTPAAAWENQISEEVKADRLQRVNRLAKTHALERSQRYLGREVEVLVEERNVKQPEQVERAYMYLYMYIHISHTHKRTHTHTHTQIDIYIYTYICVYIDIYIYDISDVYRI